VRDAAVSASCYFSARPCWAQNADLNRMHTIGDRLRAKSQRDNLSDDDTLTLPQALQAVNREHGSACPVRAPNVILMVSKE
jgi:hypothetical protein